MDFPLRWRRYHTVKKKGNHKNVIRDRGSRQKTTMSVARRRCCWLAADQIDKRAKEA